MYFFQQNVFTYMKKSKNVNLLIIHIHVYFGKITLKRKTDDESKGIKNYYIPMSFLLLLQVQQCLA